MINAKRPILMLKKTPTKWQIGNQIYYTPYNFRVGNCTRRLQRLMTGGGVHGILEMQFT
jgi:hypothetical protein